MSRKCIFASVFLLVTLCFLSNHLYAGEAQLWTQHPEWLWCDDFEGGKTVKENYQDVSENGFGISTQDAFDGTRSLMQHYTASQVNAGWVIRVNNEGFPPHLFMRWYHKFEHGFEGFPPKMARMRYRNRSGNWLAPLEVHCWIGSSGIVVADVKATTSRQANSSGWLPVAKSSFSFNNPANIGRWVCFEMEVKLNTPGKADGHYRIWADDSLIVERTGVDLRGSENLLINEVMLDCYWNGGSPKVQKRYFDNFIISTKRIGPMKTEVKTIPIEEPKKKSRSSTKSSVKGFLIQNGRLGSGVYFPERLGNREKVYSLSGVVSE